MKKKQITEWFKNNMWWYIFIAYAIFFGAMFLIASVSATAIFPGECTNVSFPNAEPVNFTLVSGDPQILNFFNWTKNGTNITYCFAKDSIIGNWTFKWSNEEEIIVNEGGSGGYSSPSIISSEQLNEGITKILKESQSFNFIIKEQHKFTIFNIIGNMTTIKVESSIETFNLNLRESYTFCLDNRELKTTLIEITNNKATIKLKTLDNCYDIPKNETIQSNETIPTESEQPIFPSPENRQIIYIIMGFVALALTIFFSIYLKRKGRKRKENAEKKPKTRKT